MSPAGLSPKHSLMAALDSLVIYRKQLGDVLLLQPALEWLAQRGSVGVATRPAFADLLALMPGRIVLAPRFLPRARHVYCLETRRGAIAYAASAIGARRHLLKSKERGSGWHRLVFSEISVTPGRDMYRAALFHAMLDGRSEDFRPPRLESPPADWLPTGLPARYGVIHPTAAWEHKTWSAGKWCAALQERGGDLPWVVTAGPAPWEQALAGQLAAGLGGRAINLAGRTNLRQYLAVLANARLALCVDGSASHLAAAFGKPTLTLFGPTNPIHWHYPGPATLRLAAKDFCAEARPPVDAIPVAAVGAAIDRLLAVAHG